MVSLNPYLNFNGNAGKAFNFYKSVFGGEFSSLQRFKDMPEGTKVADSDKNKIMHIALPIGKGNTLMGADVLDTMGQKLTAGNNFSILISTESKAEADKTFNALSHEGKIMMPLADAFWGAYYGMFTDKFGIQWMVNYEYKKEESRSGKTAAAQKA